MIFDNLEVKKYIYNSLKDLKFEKFTKVQKEVIESFDSKNNILVKSKTGSGKTHAFLIPIFNNIDEKMQAVQVVIITPTTELANQLYKVASHMASFCGETITIRKFCGGSDRNKEIEKLKKSQPQIVIGTPGKIKDLVIDENVLKIYTAKYLVIDEVDMALSAGFMEDLDSVINILKEKKMIFLSATINERLEHFIKKYIENPRYINISSDTTLNIEHIWIPIKHYERTDMLLKLTKTINPYLALVFVNKKENVGKVVSILKEEGYSVGAIHGDLTPRERKRALTEANSLKYQYIVCTDLAARGIDIDGVSHVINFEIPQDYEFYVHRSGRTGRMHYSGISFSFYHILDEQYLINLNKKGINPIYKDIKNNELVDYKGRNSRENREKPIKEEVKTAKRMLKKPTKVKPGYKKKFNEEAEKLAKKIKTGKGKKGYRK